MTRKILFVDDDPVFLQLFAQHFISDDIFCALNAAQARHILASQGSFDIVVTDLQMPEEDGLSLAQFIHQAFPQTLIFMLSSHMTEETWPPYIYRFLSKPIKLETLDHYLRTVEKT